jgi:hypothetical protein
MIKGLTLNTHVYKAAEKDQKISNQSSAKTMSEEKVES